MSAQGLKAIGTHASEKIELPAVRLAVGEKVVELAHAAVALASESRVEALLAAAASVSAVALPEVTAHRNRDGGLAMAAGRLPKGFVWPEDEETVSAALSAAAVPISGERLKAVTTNRGGDG
jgi:hypothetical protein